MPIMLILMMLVAEEDQIFFSMRSTPASKFYVVDHQPASARMTRPAYRAAILVRFRYLEGYLLGHSRGSFQLCIPAMWRCAAEVL